MAEVHIDIPKLINNRIHEQIPKLGQPMKPPAEPLKIFTGTLEEASQQAEQLTSETGNLIGVVPGEKGQHKLINLGENTTAETPSK
jgi:hypothetical protein